MTQPPRNIEARDRWTPKTDVDWNSVYQSLLGWSRTPGWAAIEAEVRARFGGFSQLRTIELGAGLAKISLLVTLKGARPTILDYNAAVLAQTREVWEEIGLKAEFIQANILHLPDFVADRFDLSMSFGTAEHFLGEERQTIFRAHCAVLRPGGLSIIWVPNKWGVYYRIAHGFQVALGRWPKDLVEVPFTRSELIARAREAGFRNTRVIGGDTLSSDFRTFIWGNARAAIRRLTGRRGRDRGPVSSPTREDWERLRGFEAKHVRASYLGDRFSYPFVLFGTR